MKNSQTLKTITFEEAGPEADTILILHGAFSSHAAFLGIARLLQAKGYHIILPDLPGHGSGDSGEIRPFTIQKSVDLLSELIKNCAHIGKAHLVGFSLGADVALSLAAEHPDLIRRIYLTGAGRYWDCSSLKLNATAYAMYAMANPPAFLAKWFNNRHMIMEAPELTEDALLWKDRRDLALSQEVVSELAEWSRSDVLDRINTPVLLISASAHDSVDGQRVFKERMIKGGCPEVKTLELKGWPHAWDGRDPQLFADSVDDWIQKRPLPIQFTTIP